MGILTDIEIANIPAEPYYRNGYFHFHEYAKSVAEAQARKVFEEIKTHMRYVGTDNCGYYTISLGEWQTLKKEVK